MDVYQLLIRNKLKLNIPKSIEKFGVHLRWKIWQKRLITYTVQYLVNPVRFPNTVKFGVHQTLFLSGLVIFRHLGNIQFDFQ